MIDAGSRFWVRRRPARPRRGALGIAGATPTAVALGWVLSRRGVTSVIIGPRTWDQYEQNMAGFDLQLDEALIKRLSDASRWTR